MEIERIAEICHEVNRGLCEALGDDSQVRWADTPEWQWRSKLNGVRSVQREGPDPKRSHENWLAEKKADGWVYGEVKDAEAKTHPCMVPFDDLPIEQQLKDHLFVTVANVLLWDGK